MLAIDGFKFSFENSFNASAKGWGIPEILTLLGPFRICEYPITLRSNKVKNAIAARAMIKVIIKEEKEDSIKT